MGNSTAKIQKYLKQALKEWIEFANRHGIRYALAGGNLLGAIRHKGFIPWDDDLDLDIPVADMQLIMKFRQDLPLNWEFVWEKHRLHPRIYLRNIEINYFGHKNNLWIDLFPVYSTNYSQFGKVKKKGAILGNFLFAQRNPFIKKKYKLLRLPLLMFPPFLVHKLHMRLVKKYEKPNGHYLFSALTSGFYFLPCSFANLKQVEFDGIKVMTYANTDQYLKILYGDWRKIPKPENRVTHNIKITHID